MISIGSIRNFLLAQSNSSHNQASKILVAIQLFFMIILARIVIFNTVFCIFYKVCLFLHVKILKRQPFRLST